MTTTRVHRVFKGICVSPGIGIGRAFAYHKRAPVITRRRVAQHLVAPGEKGPGRPSVLGSPAGRRPRGGSSEPAGRRGRAPAGGPVGGQA